MRWIDRSFIPLRFFLEAHWHLLSHMNDKSHSFCIVDGGENEKKQERNKTKERNMVRDSSSAF